MKTSENSAKFQPIDRDGLVERVANLLSDAIIKGQMKPGDRLSESVIAREMGLSRAPVREAARLLESSGLVAYQPNRGFFVRKISAQQLDDLYDLRIAIEVAAARRVLRHGDDALLDGLREQYETLKAVSNIETDMHVQVEADMEFHRRMILASGNPRFLKIFDQIARETELSIVVIGTLYGDPEWIAETHVPILEALAARDEPGVVAAIEYHIGEAQRLVTQQFRLLEDK
ncbi:FCD domain-containing protein [Epibacterium sp. SM1979]|uniref:FCD domain-containing protein n=1 Tax=Tritonibacter litoralis TaxID=2662264 RepID=A0A843YDS9_9RHOB|nr:GntR family transcriptional regulator [Tritonibacter litoralis]MQQ09071.1 FCD domain-containing protein [Tritonibacter litoralis]